MSAEDYALIMILKKLSMWEASLLISLMHIPRQLRGLSREMKILKNWKNQPARLSKNLKLVEVKLIKIVSRKLKTSIFQ